MPVPTITIDAISDSQEVRLCRTKFKPSIPENPASGGFSAVLADVEYLPGKKMKVVATYSSIHDEVVLSATSGARTIISVMSGLGSAFEASASVGSDTLLRILIENEEA